jgi:CHAT domain-containing protein
MVLGPVADKLGDKRLLVVGDGVLQYIPFGALPAPASATPARPGAAGQTGRRKGVPYLIEEHEIVSLPSMSTLAVLRSEMAGRKAAPLSVAVLADPVFDAGDPRLKMKGDGSPPSGKDPAAGGALPGGTGDVLLRSGLKLIPLPATEKEAQAIRSAVAPNPVKVSLGLEASRDTVTNLQEGKYRVIHFATHGVFNAEHPELSGLVLSMVDAEGRARDGVLRLHDIYNLRLPADLVVLSACSTGLGSIVKGEGLIGLTRGFMYAGSPRVVASLWRVEDLGTSVLMKRFYYQMAKQGHAPAAALRQAQIEMLKGRRWRSPYYWAGFALQGEWRAMR